MRHKYNLIYVRSFRGVNINSDHFLVVSKLRARLVNYKRGCGAGVRKYDVDNFKNDEISVKYKQKLDNKFNLIDIETPNRNEHWHAIKSAIATAAEETIGVKDKVKDNDWFDEECEVASWEKNKAYLLMPQSVCTRQSTEEYNNKRREEQKVHRKKKINYENQRLRDIEESRNANESRKLYILVNSDGRAFKPRITICKDAEGNTITTKVQILER
jgi:hypothetical protein